MRKIILSILVILLIMLWVGEPPHTSHGQIGISPPILANEVVIDTSKRVELEKTDSTFKVKAKLLNSKIQEAQKNREEIDNIHLKAVREIKKQSKTTKNITVKDSVILVHVNTDTIFFPDTVLVKEPFLTLEGKSYFGKWWRAQVKLIKQCTLGKNTKQYFKAVKGKLVKNESKKSSRDTGNREEVPR